MHEEEQTVEEIVECQVLTGILNDMEDRENAAFYGAPLAEITAQSSGEWYCDGRQSIRLVD